MDMIYMNSLKEDIGVIKDYTMDVAIGADENNFECVVDESEHCCEAGYFIYFENTEYGGMVDSIEVDTDSKEVRYSGRTWHGILNTKILQPDVNEDYLTVSGEANAVLGALITRMGLQSFFNASEEDSEITITNYKMNRYIGGYDGIKKMLKSVNAKLKIAFADGYAMLKAEPLVNYAEDEQFDTDLIDFNIKKNFKPVNHVICMGQGDLKNRRIIHMFCDSMGNISGTQTFTGIDEITAVYDYPNAESDDELKKGGVEIIEKSRQSLSVDFSFNSNEESFDIGDIIGANERITGVVVTAMINKKIINIANNITSISYSCEGYTGSVSSGDYPSSGGGGSIITVDDEMSTVSTNPVQNKVITAAINNKVSKNGDTMTDSLLVKKDMDASVAVANLGTREICLRIGSGQTNRGIYDIEKAHWLFHYDDNKYYVNGDKEIAVKEDLKIFPLTYSARQSSANLAIIGDGAIRHFKSTASMTVGKPAADGHIIHIAWDNNGGYDSELYIPNNPNVPLQFRMQLGASGNWDNWKSVAVENVEMKNKLFRKGGGSYIVARNNVAISGDSYGQPSGNSYNVVCGQKTNLGYWAIGNTSGSENLQFVYGTDVNFNKGSNVTTMVQLPLTAGTIAVNGSSSMRYKKNIEDMPEEYAKNILKLRPVKFDYIDESQGQNLYGLIAEEVNEIETFPVISENGTIEGVDYLRLIPQLIKMIQIQQKEIDKLKALII